MKVIARAIVILSFIVLANVAEPSRADTYATIDFPGAVSTEATGISASGEVVGFYTDGIGTIHGFRLRDGVFSPIDYPGALQTFALSIDASGDAAGFFLDPAINGMALSSPALTTSFRTIRGRRPGALRSASARMERWSANSSSGKRSASSDSRGSCATASMRS